jgi:hypothetical protein
VQRLAHEAELAVLEVAQPAVDHARRGRGGASGKIRLVHEQRVDAVERELAQEAGAIDAAAEDEHVRREGLRGAQAGKGGGAVEMH